MSSPDITPADELTCWELVELVTDYLEGSMAIEDRVRFELHLVFCAGCVTYVDQMRETIRLTGMLREEQLSPEGADALLQAFRGWKRGG